MLVFVTYSILALHVYVCARAGACVCVCPCVYVRSCECISVLVFVKIGKCMYVRLLNVDITKSLEPDAGSTSPDIVCIVLSV